VKLFHLSEGLLRSFKRSSSEESQLWVVIGGSEKKPVVMCGNWNVRQAVSQQVYRVTPLTTFCIHTGFQSFLTLISRTVHHAVLKFSQYHKKPLQQASKHVHINTRAPPDAFQTQY